MDALRCPAGTAVNKAVIRVHRDGECPTAVARRLGVPLYLPYLDLAHWRTEAAAFEASVARQEAKFDATHPCARLDLAGLEMLRGSLDRARAAVALHERLTEFVA